MSLPFSKVPSAASIAPTPFEASIPQEQVSELKTLVKLSKIASPTYESVQSDRRFGITTAWLASMKEKWVNDFYWRACERKINSCPQFTATIEDIKIHFVALFSEKKDAVPIVFLHGWPGSFMEFLPILHLFRHEFTPDTLPYHIIVPSLPGYAFSSGPPLDRNYTTDDVARIVDKLLRGLGFHGYVAQGGDIGSAIARTLAVDYECCKAVHLNFCPTTRPEGVSDYSLTEFENSGLERDTVFRTTGLGYAMEQGTRTSTIGHALSASPVSLLAWVGEKFLDWVDDPLSSQEILESVSLYWFTETFPRGIYFYREMYAPRNRSPLPYIRKPFGFSHFPMELMPVPKSWIAATGNLSFFRGHDQGGHFAAFERPKELKADVVDFVAQVWPAAATK